MGASSVKYLLARAFNNIESSADIYKATQAAEDNKLGTSFIENLVFAESKSVRTSTVILASFNVLAAFATAASILYDCYWTSKRCNPKFKASKFCVSWIHPAETFPLVLSIGIVIQGILFAAVQGQGLQSLFLDKCSTISQIMWVALFIVPYTQLIFGLECAIRSLRKNPFQPRGKYDVTICLGIIVVMLIGTWIPTHLRTEHDHCFASLLWFISDFGEIGFILLATVAGLFLISAVVIFVRLSRSNMVEQNQRIAASRMVYYMAIGFVSLGFVIPYFVSETISNGDLKAAMMATVVLNLSGLMNGLLQLFLRSNTATTSFGPKGGPWPVNKHDIKLWGRNELGFDGHMMDPVQQPDSPRAELASRAESQRNLIVGPEKFETPGFSEIGTSPLPSPLGPNPLRSNAVLPPTPAVTITPTPAARSPSSHTRKQSYSLFPSALESPTALRMVPTNRDLSDLEPPPPLHFGKRGHRRESSVASSATVQIGLRISHALPQKIEDASPLPSTTYKAPFLPVATFNAPTSRFNPSSPRERMPMSLAPLQTKNLSEVPLPPRSPHRPSPLANTENQASQEQSVSPQKSPVNAAINKSLPATPKHSAIERLEQSEDTIIQLSPSVYTPPTGPLRRTESTRTVEMGLESLGPSVYTPPVSNAPKRNASTKTPLRSDSNRAPSRPDRKDEWI
ncbi:Bile salt-activated lipase protein [Rutstroemia sp. NJR-2017a BBW]|nr:Bile salt-activated lipase protein [Rutstroemia sp. NJR-2017a BBW]